ncbi:type IV pilus assembly protein PilW [Alteromonadaceae bacterium Bs31]|nr:type IV pilus assembly protein PilW [Alteromonadaceae bacterium Bs31]
MKVIVGNKEVVRVVFQRGVSLVEVMVSITVGLFILAGVVQLYATSTQNAAVVDGSSVIQENARFVFSKLEKDIAQAGFTGCFSMANSGDRITSVVTGITDTDAVDANDANHLYNFSAGFVYGKNDEKVNNSKAYDQLLVRYFSASSRQPLLSEGSTSFKVADTSGFKADRLALVGNCSRAAIFKVTKVDGGDISFSNGLDFDLGGVVITKANAEGANSGTAAHNLYGGKSGAFRYKVDTSAAGKSNGKTCTNTTPQFCALVRHAGLSAAGKPIVEELVEGVDELEIEYGWQNHSNGTLYFGDAAEVTTAGMWNLVDRVKVTLSLNSINRTPTNDGSELLSRTYSRTFMVRNQFPGDKVAIALTNSTP